MPLALIIGTREVGGHWLLSGVLVGVYTCVYACEKGRERFGCYEATGARWTEWLLVSEQPVAP